MCMTLAAARCDIGLVAADTRYSGPRGCQDLGGRVRRTPSGWAVGTGVAATMLVALRALESAELASRQAVHRAAARLADEAGIDVLKRPTLIVVLKDGDQGGLLQTIYQDGRGDDMQVPSNGTWLRVEAPPPGMSEAAQRSGSEGLLEALNSATDVAATLRGVARAFVYGRKHGEDMSPELEIGVTVNGKPLYLRAPAAQLAGASDSTIKRALTPPPPFPSWMEHPAERFVFGDRRLNLQPDTSP